VTEGCEPNRRVPLGGTSIGDVTSHEGVDSRPLVSEMQGPDTAQRQGRSPSLLYHTRTATLTGLCSTIEVTPRWNWGIVPDHIAEANT